MKKNKKKFGKTKFFLYLCTPKLTNGVMVTQQILVLSF
jgi:hypothetical protein